MPPAGLAYLLAAGAVAPLIVFALTTPDAHRLNDLKAYIGAGQTVLHGGDVYSFATKAGYPFTYPPFAALLSACLAIPPPMVI